MVAMCGLVYAAAFVCETEGLVIQSIVDNLYRGITANSIVVIALTRLGNAEVPAFWMLLLPVVAFILNMCCPRALSMIAF